MIYDISRPLSEKTAVWPGDSPVALAWSATKSETGSVNVGALSMSTHAGTHVDAPLHYDDDGPSVDQYDLSLFIGPAYVLHAPDVDVLLPQHVRLSSPTRRLLIRTRVSDRSGHDWSDDFPAFHPETISALADAGVRLVGTDAPSYDPADSKNLPAHHALSRHRMANLENLDLKAVPMGFYTLVALPLRLVGMDAAPVRAVLLPPPPDLHINVTAHP